MKTLNTKTFEEVKNQVFDASGIDYPNEWSWYRQNNIWYPHSKLDLFEYPHLIPENIQKILNGYDDCSDYRTLSKMVERLNEIGFTFDYYLDAQPYDLVRI
jgi:hypothetical protein